MHIPWEPLTLRCIGADKVAGLIHRVLGVKREECPS